MDAGQQTAAALLLLSPVIWGLCGGVGVALLWRKGYGRASGASFGFLGVLGGLLTLCAGLTMGPKRATAKACPYCRFAVPLDALVCGHCGSVLIEPPAVVDITPPQQGLG